MTKYKYIVWVDGSVEGEYTDEFDAEQVASDVMLFQKKLRSEL